MPLKVNKVILGSETIMDVTDATAGEGDIVEGKSAYLKSGEKATGTLGSKEAVSGGTDLSLVTTGEKYTWDHKSTFSGSYNDLTNKPQLGQLVVRVRLPMTTKFNNANYGIGTVDITKTGYTPVGVVGFLGGQNSVIYRVSSINIASATTVTVTVVNQTAAAETSTQTGWIDVLYVKNAFA